MSASEASSPITAEKIRIANDVHPAHVDSAGTPISRADTGFVGGVYNTRAIDRRLSLSRAITFDLSFDLRPTLSVPQNNEDPEDGRGWLDDGAKKKQVFKASTMLLLAYQSIGVIYGDIGTSPLYVFSSTFTSAPDPNSVVQVLSVVIWGITLMVTVKYVLIILLADNDGEGGTFSTYSLLTRFANITDRDPRQQQLVRVERQKTMDLDPSTGRIRSALEKSMFVRGLLKAIAVMSVSMVMADGVLTPAQSVLGAVQGLSVVSPDISNPIVVGVTCAIIVLLFLIQPLGTSKLASAFAPIVILWLGFNLGFGIFNLVHYDWTVLRAFSPYFAIRFFVDYKTEGWKMLGGVLLSFTGVEALFADLGAFSLGAIRLSWLAYTYPCLLLSYIGQAAFISEHPDAYSNPFFNSVPPGMLYPSLVLAVLAAVVASQAIITATFQLVSQLMKLSYCPQVKVVHTSNVFHGQVYVPFLNWMLMVGAVLVTAVYRDTTRLGNAYGVCVMFVTFFDTCMVTLVALIVWRINPIIVFLPWLAFATLDGLFLSSSLIKVPEGAWLTLLASGILAGLFLLWRFGKENQWRAEAEDRFRPGSLITTVDPDNAKAKGDDAASSSPLDFKYSDPVTETSTTAETETAAVGQPGALRLTERFGGDDLARIKGMGIFFDKTGIMTPTVFSQFVTKLVAVPEVMVFFHLHPVEEPTVPDSQRYVVSRMRAIPGCYRLVVRHGFMDEVISPDLAGLVYEQVRAYIAAGRAERGARDDDYSSAVATGAAAVTQAADTDGADSDGRRRDGETVSGEAVDDAEGPWGDRAVRQRRGLPPAGLASAVGTEKRARIAAELAKIEAAYSAKVMYVVGKGQMRVRAETGWVRTVLLSTFLWIRENTRAKIANLRLSMDRVVEVGFVKDI